MDGAKDSGEANGAKRGRKRKADNGDASDGQKTEGKIGAKDASEDGEKKKRTRKSEDRVEGETKTVGVANGRKEAEKTGGRKKPLPQNTEAEKVVKKEDDATDEANGDANSEADEEEAV